MTSPSERPGAFDLVTPTYAPDFERCRLLCDSVDRFVTGHRRHLIIVDRLDEPLFRPLAGPRRQVVTTQELLPSWLVCTAVNIGRMRRRIWLSPFALPVHGWHVQQLKKIAAGLEGGAETVLFADSDVAFVRPFDVRRLEAGGRLRLLRVEKGITAETPAHIPWTATSSRLLDLPHPGLPATDYVGHLIAWRRSAVEGLCRRIEGVTGTDWVTALLRARSFSEYLLYGRFVDEVAGGAGHRATDASLCHSYWDFAALEESGIEAFLRDLGPGQVAVSINSVSGTSVADLRGRLARSFDRARDRASA